MQKAINIIGWIGTFLVVAAVLILGLVVWIVLWAIGVKSFDAFLITPNKLAVVVGDVVGRGIDAATTMGQLRSALRVYAWEEHARPAAALRLAELLVALRGQGQAGGGDRGLPQRRGPDGGLRATFRFRDCARSPTRISR